MPDFVFLDEQAFFPNLKSICIIKTTNPKQESCIFNTFSLHFYDKQLMMRCGG